MSEFRLKIHHASGYVEGTYTEAEMEQIVGVVRDKPTAAGLMTGHRPDGSEVHIPWRSINAIEVKRL